MPRKAPIWSRDGLDAGHRPVVGAELGGQHFLDAAQPGDLGAEVAALLAGIFVRHLGEAEDHRDRPALHAVEAAFGDAELGRASGRAPRGGRATPASAAAPSCRASASPSTAGPTRAISSSSISSTSSCASRDRPIERRRAPAQIGVEDVDRAEQIDARVRVREQPEGGARLAADGRQPPPAAPAPRPARPPAPALRATAP